MVTGKEIILTQAYKLLLNVFQAFGVNRQYRIPYSWGILKFGSN